MLPQFSRSTTATLHHEPLRGMASGAISHSSEGAILALDADATLLRICLLEVVNQRYRLLAQQVQQRQVDRLLSTQFAQLAAQLGDKLGRTIWDAHSGGPLLQSNDPIRRPPIEHVVGTATLRPFMRVWLAGLSAEGSIAAALQVAPRGPIQVVGQTVLQAAASVSDIGVALAAASPDLLILCGGYEAEQRAIQDSALRLAELLTNALKRLAPAQHPTILYAGNGLAAAAVEQHFRAQIPTIRMQIVENLAPRPGQVHYAALLNAVEQEQLRLSRRMPDFGKITQWLTGPSELMSMESAFIRFVQAWMVLEKLEELHALYATPQRWLHVGATRAPGTESGAEIELYFALPETRPMALAGWPALQLVSGDWPTAQWPRPAASWWDRQALAPAMAAVGQLSLSAMQQIIAVDIF